MLWLYILIFIASCLVLIKSGTVVIKTLSQVTRFLRWSEFAVAFLLMAVLTSLPEFFVGISSALHQTPELAFGNVMGSNIINLTLAVAIPVLMAGSLRADSIIVQRSSIYTALIVFLPILLMFDGAISRIDGLILLLLLPIYFYWLFQQKERFSKVFNKLERDIDSHKDFLKNLAVFVLAVVVLLISAEGVVWSASQLAQGFGFSLLMIGVLFVALGTTLPEVIFGIKAVSLGHQDMVLGNLMGSVVVNSTLVLGVTALIHPFRLFDPSPYLAAIVAIIVTIFFFTLFIRSGRKITRKEALFLLFLYLAFISSQFLLR